MFKNLINSQQNLFNFDKNYNTTNDIKMSTVDIAELTGKEHNKVMIDCNKQLSKICTLANFRDRYKTSRGNEYDCYLLPKREVLILVSGYSVELRAKIIDRLEELEKGLNKRPETKLEWIQFALEQEKQIIALNSKIKEDKPKVECYERVMETKGLLSIEQFSKLYSKELKLGRNNLYKLLRQANIIRENNLPYQKYMHLFEVKENTYTVNDKEKLYIKLYIKLEYQELIFNRLKKLIS